MLLTWLVHFIVQLNANLLVEFTNTFSQRGKARHGHLDGPKINFIRGKGRV